MTRRPDGNLFDRFERVSGAVRDLVTDGLGDGTVVDTARLEVALEDGLIVRVEPEPFEASVCDGLLGVPIGFSFRSSAKDVLMALSGTGLGLLVDDLAGAAPAAGYAGIRHGALAGAPLIVPTPVATPTADAPPPRTQLDVCAGWRAGGVATERRESGGPLPLADPWAAPSLASDDPLAWHDMPTLTPLQTRRLRRVDLWREGDQLVVDLMFRDLMVDPDGTERVVHEYAVAGRIDEATMTVSALSADPRALPFAADCPLAAGSAAFIVGQPVGDLRRTVRKVSAGPSSCTHLNDLYRTIADVTTLAGHLRERG
jgi:hypothetical protein